MSAATRMSAATMTDHPSSDRSSGGHPSSDRAVPTAKAHPDAPFWNRMARRYAARPVDDEAAYETKLAMTREHLTPASEVLEFGCGTGSTAIRHAPFARHVRAFDVSERMIEIARERAAEAGVGNVAFETAPLEALRVPDASLDMVMAHSILHLVADRDAALAKAYRWLKPGGTFVSSTACLADMAPWLRPLAPVARLFGLFPPTLRFFTERELTEGLTAQGFTIERRFQPKPKAAVFLIARKPA